MRAAMHAAAAACPHAAAAPQRQTKCHAAAAAAAAAASRRRCAVPQLPPRCTHPAALAALSAAATRARRGAACGPRDAASASSAAESLSESLPLAATPLTSLDAFLSAHGTAALLGYAVVQDADGVLVGHVAEVLAVSGGEVVMGVKGASGDADADDDALADMLAGLSPLTQDDDEADETAAAESLLLRVEGTGCVHMRKSVKRARKVRLPTPRVLTPLVARRRAYEWECFVPLASALVPGVEVAARRLRIAPPGGLIESGELPHLLAWLRQQLTPYLTRAKSGALGARCVAAALPRVCVQARALTPLPPARRPLRLPARRELLRVGRADLVATIARAGGFAAVAAQLRLRGVRKPPGYWDDPDILEMCVATHARTAPTPHHTSPHAYRARKHACGAERSMSTHALAGSCASLCRATGASTERMRATRRARRTTITTFRARCAGTRRAACATRTAWTTAPAVAATRTAAMKRAEEEGRARRRA
jgi:hypothetical protein